MQLGLLRGSDPLRLTSTVLPLLMCTYSMVVMSWQECAVSDSDCVESLEPPEIDTLTSGYLCCGRLGSNSNHYAVLNRRSYATVGTNKQNPTPLVRGVMTTVVDNETLIRLFMHSSLATSLALEINTGLKARRVFFRTVSYTPMDACKEVCGSVKRNKRAVLREYVAWLESIAPERFGMEWSPNPSVRKAMGEK